MCKVLGHVFLVLFVSTNAAPNLRVIGGDIANIRHFPYMVSMHDNYEFLCGGSILDEKTILTAAHCVYGNSQDYEIHILYGNESVRLGNRSEVSSMISHADFVYSPPWTHDIALLKLSNPIQFSETAQPIKLPKANERTPVNKIAALAGWGVIEVQTVKFPDLLHIVNLTIFSDEECFNSYHGLDDTDIDVETQICAGDQEGGKGQCHGDSGGPLIIDGVQYGIVSFSKGCAEKGYPGALTKVSAYIDWINEHR